MRAVGCLEAAVCKWLALARATGACKWLARACATYDTRRTQGHPGCNPGLRTHTTCGCASCTHMHCRDTAAYSRPRTCASTPSSSASTLASADSTSSRSAPPAEDADADPDPDLVEEVAWRLDAESELEPSRPGLSLSLSPWRPRLRLCCLPPRWRPRSPSRPGWAAWLPVWRLGVAPCRLRSCFAYCACALSKADSLEAVDV